LIAKSCLVDELVEREALQDLELAAVVVCAHQFIRVLAELRTKPKMHATSGYSMALP
jgi:hypothetical protein